MRTPAGLVFDLRSAARSLWRRPGYSATVAVTLALALGALTSTLAIVQGVLLRPLPYPEPDRLVVLCEQHPSLARFCVGSPPNASDWMTRTKSFVSLGLARDWGFTLAREGERIPVRGGLASDGLFRVLAFQPVLGRGFEPADLRAESRVAVLSHAFWVAAFGADSGVIGRSIVLDDSTWTVIGVLGAGDVVPTITEAQLWAPLPFPTTDPSQRGWRGFQVFGRLAPGVSVAGANIAVRSVAHALAAEFPATNAGYDVLVRDAREEVVGDARPLLLVFLTATVMVLLVAAANIANLMLARASARTRELAVQAAIGGGRARIMRSFGFESILFALAGAAGALVIAQLVLGAFLQLAPPGIPRLDGVAIGWSAALAALVLGILVSAFAALLPLLRLRRLDLSTALRSVAGSAHGSQRGRAFLVVAQVAMAVTLLAGAALLIRTFRNLAGWQPGFETSHLLVGWTSASSGRYPNGASVATLQQHVRAVTRSIPGVVSAGGVSNGPLFGGEEPGTFRTRDPGPERRVTGRWYDASEGYFETLGVPLVRGRSIAASDVAGAPLAAVINETFAREMWPGEDPLGKRVALDETDAPVLAVVGVVRDVPPFRAGELPVPELWWSFDQAPRWGTYLVVRTSGSPDQMARVIHDRLQADVPTLEMGTLRAMPELIARRLVAPRFSLALVSAFAGLALLMAVIGLYGLVSFVVGLRQREFAIRMALGASAPRLRGAVIRQGSAMTGAGVGIGLLGAFLLGRILRSQLAGVGAFDPVSFLSVALLLGVCGVLAAWLPAVRASKADPTALLRTE